MRVETVVAVVEWWVLGGFMGARVPLVACVRVY